MQLMPTKQPAQLKDIFHAWEPAYEADAVVKMSTSRWFLFRGLADARKTILQSKLMLAIPAWTYFVSNLTAIICVAMSLSIFVLSIVSPWNETLFAIFIAVFLVSAVGWFSICWAYRTYLTTPHKSLELMPDQEVRRGCLVNVNSGFGSEVTASAGPPASNSNGSVLMALLGRREIHLVDFEMRGCVYRIRSCVLGVVLLASAAVGVCTRLEVVDTEMSAKLYVFIVLLKCTLLMDTVAAACGGLNSSFYGQIGAACLRCDKAFHFRKSHFIPFDPRATCVQNLVFSSVLMPNTFMQFFLVLREPDWPRCPSMWALQATSAFLILLIKQIGAAYSFCPFTFAVGVMVKNGMLPPPVAQCGDGVVRMLAYGIMGPIVELPEPPVAAGDEELPEQPVVLVGEQLPELSALPEKEVAPADTEPQSTESSNG